MSRKRKPLLYLLDIAFLGALLITTSCAYTQTLTLKQAELLALAESPEIQSFRAKNESLYQAAIAAGQLPDTHIYGGTLNVPVDNFSFNETPMTQIQVGIGQVFPKGKSLRYQALEKKRLSEVETHKLQAMRLDILQKVRLSWLNLYYWQQSRRIILQQKKIFQNLLDVAKSMLANNKAQQKDVIRAQLELSALDNRLIQIEQQVKTAQFQLARWIGETKAYNAQTKKEPKWPSLPKKTRLIEKIKQHPELKADTAQISAFRAKVDLAMQQYKPGFNTNLAYGFRQGREPNGKKRSDLLTATINMDLPIFTYNRQDRTLKASEERLMASEKDRQSHFKNLRETLNIQYNTWQQQQKSSLLYQSSLIPLAKQYAFATMTAYQNFQTDFPTLTRAYVRQLNIELEELKIRVDRDIARIGLLYLQEK